MNLISPTIADHIVMVILGVILPIFTMSRPAPELEEMKLEATNKIDIYFTNGLTMLVVTLIVCFVWFFSGRPMYEIGFEFPQFNGSLWAVLITVVVLIVVIEEWNQVRTIEKRTTTLEQLQEDIAYIPTNKVELQHFAILSFTTAFCEEVIFRGFFVQYFLSFSGASPLGQLVAVTLSGVIFAISHLHQGWKTIGKIMVSAIIFGYIFLETKSIWLVVILHFLIDLMGGYLAMRMLKEEE